MEANYLAVLVAGLGFFALGALWYQNFSFGKMWQNALGFTDEYIQEGNMALTFGLSLVMMLIMVFGLVPVLEAHGDTLTTGHGAFHGAMIGIFFCAPAIAINCLYQRRPFILWLIDAAYQILGLTVAGAIYAAMS